MKLLSDNVFHPESYRSSRRGPRKLITGPVADHRHPEWCKYGDMSVVAVRISSTSQSRPRVVIERSPDHLTPAEQKRVSDWIEELSILMENAQEKSTGTAKGELWSRLKYHFDVPRYELIGSLRMAEVKAWYQGVKREIQNSARRKAPEIFRGGKIPGIKAAMREMGRTNEEYYPEIAHRLEIRRYSSLKDLSVKNLERVYNLVRRDLSRK